MQKGSALIAFVLIGFVVIFGGGYLFFNYQNQKTPQSFIPTLGKSNDNLETYTNKDFGFEFKYLNKDLTVKDDSEQYFNKRGNGDFRKNFKGYIGYEPENFLGAVTVLEKVENFDTSPFTLWIFDNSNNLNVDDWYKNYWYYPFVWGDYTIRRNDVAPVNDATISGRLAKSGVVGYQPGSPKLIYLSDSNKMYLFRIIGDQGEKILQSFKFINSEVQKQTGGCVIGGCSSRLCAEESEGNIVSTCEYREEYACFKTAKCEKQSSGKCGWSETEELNKCLQDKRSNSSEIVF